MTARARTTSAEGIEAAKEAFLKACSRGESNKADHIFLWLWDHVPAIEAFDLLMSVALPKNTLDDHYFLFPGYLWRGLETLGTEHLKVLFRPAVRYVARFPTQRAGAGGRCADRAARPADPHPAPAQRRRRDRRGSASSAKPSAAARSTPRSRS